MLLIPPNYAMKHINLRVRTALWHSVDESAASNSHTHTHTKLHPPANYFNINFLFCMLFRGSRWRNQHPPFPIQKKNHTRGILWMNQQPPFPSFPPKQTNKQAITSPLICGRSWVGWRAKVTHPHA